jgi:hypothetical protein
MQKCSFSQPIPGNSVTLVFVNLSNNLQRASGEILPELPNESSEHTGCQRFTLCMFASGAQVLPDWVRLNLNVRRHLPSVPQAAQLPSRKEKNEEESAQITKGYCRASRIATKILNAAAPTSQILRGIAQVIGNRLFRIPSLRPLRSSVNDFFCHDRRLTV